MPELVTLTDIERAAERLRGVTVRTPLVPYPPSLGELLVKPESLQPTGAFKLRGAYTALTALPADERDRGVITHSSGNHAQAVAYAARALGVPAVLVMPRTAPTVKVEACRALGAEIVFVEPTMAARRSTAGRLADAHGYALIPPFDDPRVIAGQGTAGLEIMADAPEADVVLVPVGGGGLLSGVATAVKSLRPQTAVFGVQPELAAHARESLRLGRPIEWPAAQTGRTIADALRVQGLGELPYAQISKYADGVITVTEQEIREAMRLLALTTRLVVEPAGAVATAAYLFHRAGLPGGRAYVAVVSGGNVDPRLLAETVG
ncbi:MAG TPA: threonine/serine dehydratase [Streptosporangiaceae bacterium]|nr:threonine/serine dehydratase [Streptosporangiaceae bacterium]